MPPKPTTQRWFANALAAATAAAASLLASCKAPPQPPGTFDAPASDAPARQNPAEATKTPPQASSASTPRAYRKDAARHLYTHNTQRIYPGKMQPHLYAIGVLEVDIDKNGKVLRLHWLRAPRHAPEVVAEIERTVRAAAPYPSPTRMGRVTYTDTWLWDKSGRFQLDTLTEGQL